jgi:hypothetical protein
MPFKYVPMNKGEGAPVAPAPQAPKDEGAIPDWLQQVLAGVTRVGGTAGGATLGGILGSVVPGVGNAAGAIGGGALGGAASEYLAEKMEPGGLHKSANPGRIAVQGALGAVPGSWLIKGGKPLYNAGAGAALAYAGLAGNKIAEGEEPTKAINPLKWSGSELLMGPVLGGVAGLGVGALHGRGKAPTPPPAPTGPEFKGASGLRVALDELKGVPSGSTNPFRENLSNPAAPVKPTDRLLAAHKALAVEQAKNPQGAISSEIGPALQVASYDKDGNPVWKSPSLADMDKIHGDANATVGKEVVATEKAHGAALKEQVDAAKAQEAANKLIGKERADAAKAQTKYVEGEASQEAKNLNAKERLRRAVEKARAAADIEDTRRTDAAIAQSDAERQASEIERLRGTMPVQVEPTSMSETVSGPGEHGGKARATFRREVEPPPDEGSGDGGSGSGGGDGRTYSGDPSIIPSKEAAAATIYRGFRKAKAHADALGAADVVKVPGGWMLRFPDIEPPPAPPTSVLGGPKPPKPAPPEGGGAEAPIDKVLTAYKTYSNKVEAAYIAKATGGTVNQVGPRAYRVVFPESAPTPELPSVAEPLVSTTQLPPSKPDLPRINPEKPTANDVVNPIQTGDLTPEEFRRYMEIRPNGPNGVKKTPAELEEFRGYQRRINGNGAKPPVPAEDEGFDKFSQSVDQLASEEAASAKPPVDEPPMSVEEFAQALGKEGEKPVAELPFTLNGGKAPTGPAPVEQSVLDSPAPTEAKGGAAPARLFKSQAEAAGEGYGAIKAAKAAGEVVPEEGRAVAGRAAQRTAKEAASNATFDDLLQMTPEQQSETLSRAVKAWKNQKGAIDPMLLARLGLGGVGALAGAAAHPDDPLAGAILGGSAGVMTPSIARALMSRNMSGAMGPQTAQEAGEKIMESAKNFFRMIPDYQRFALLTKPTNLMINMWVGPYGAAVMGAIEHTLAGDPRGMEALKLLRNPATFMQRFKTAGTHAHELLASSAERTEGQMGNSGPAWWRSLSAVPGEAMTRGDIAARDILMEAGFTELEARRITLTSEPYTPLGIGLSKMVKGSKTEGGKRSWLGSMILPFYRTATNQMEQSAERTPILGFLAQNAKDVPDSLRMQIVQQLMGGGVAGASYLLGTVVPEENAKLMRKAIGDFGGQYGIVASTAFMMGQASRSGKSKLGAAAREIGQRDMPLPTADFIQTQFSIAKDLMEGNAPQQFPIPPPGFLQWGKGSDPLSIPNLIPLAQAATQKASGQTPQKQPYRYVPYSKR